MDLAKASNIRLYCPKCADRIHVQPLALDLGETVQCPSCRQGSRAGALLTGEGKTLLDFLAAESLKAAKGLGG